MYKKTIVILEGRIISLNGIRIQVTKTIINPQKGEAKYWKILESLG
jgi:hypothetical protein